MLFDDETTEHEPDLPDPEEPTAGDIGPPVPEPPNADLADRDVPEELQKTFWVLVFVFNVAVLATSLGAMFVVFEGRFTLGGLLVLAGSGTFLYGWRTYRRARKS